VGKKCAGRVYSTLAPEAFTTLAHFTTSSWMKEPNCSGSGGAIAPCCKSLSFMSPERAPCSPPVDAQDDIFRRAFGEHDAEPRRHFEPGIPVPASWAGRAARVRVLVVTASARSFPLRMCPIAAVRLSNIRSTCPP